MRLSSLLCLPLAVLVQGAPPEIAVPPAEAIRTVTGLAYRVIQPGRGGAQPTPGDFVRVHFTGWGSDGAVFANTRAQGEAPYLGLERVLPGMRESLQAMTVGEQRRVWISEALAFAGAKGRPPTSAWNACCPECGKACKP
ncbi:FKBP-type peptidyl-prolyl cis-trans isomerase [Geothrix campi]|uniref:FKBP-type peptidyl-prolyl cis-trans isomerase n=1 Tax=Geothrix campi TaxID=2966450 RepID=UPI00214834BA|nr:FKBP-type peptidyl-prolyl cis-trans isomerase [Geothrix sp. SG10]